jgi:hypothetical protein
MTDNKNDISSRITDRLELVRVETANCRAGRTYGFPDEIKAMILTNLAHARWNRPLLDEATKRLHDVTEYEVRWQFGDLDRLIEAETDRLSEEEGD